METACGHPPGPNRGKGPVRPGRESQLGSVLEARRHRVAGRSTGLASEFRSERKGAASSVPLDRLRNTLTHLPPPPGGIPKPALSCDSTECQSALAAVATDRNRVLFKCAQVTATHNRVNLMAAIAGAFLGLATALVGAAIAALATGVAAAIAVVLFIAAGSAFATATLFAVFAAIGLAQLAVQQAELNTERSRFTTDVSTVLSSCPSTCWGDITLPACSE
jgi:hypothetical protein